MKIRSLAGSKYVAGQKSCFFVVNVSRDERGGFLFTREKILKK